MKKDINKTIIVKRKEIAKRVMYLALVRIFQRVHTKLSDKEKLDMETVFTSGTDKEKMDAVKRYLPNFDKLYVQEIIDINKELKAKIIKNRRVK